MYRKKLKDLTIRDNFMFTAIMSEEDNCKPFLEMLLGIEIDRDLLKASHLYENLPATYVIFICNFDPFHLRKYCYIFENRCLQDYRLLMGDEAGSIFLSTVGENSEEIPDDLRAFLDFIKQDMPCSVF